MSELYDILVETPPTKDILLALDQGLWDCERSLAELAALCEPNHMEAVAEVTQKRQTPETGIVLGSGKLEEAAAAAAELGACLLYTSTSLCGAFAPCVRQIFSSQPSASRSSVFSRAMSRSIRATRLKGVMR